MRIDCFNTLTGKAHTVELAEGVSPVRIGSHRGCHVVLGGSDVGPEAGAIDNDVAGGHGWRFWNRGGETVRVGDVVLTARDQFARLRRPRIPVEVGPYLLTVCLTPDELATPIDDFDRLDRACADLVRRVHAGLVELHRNDPADPAEWVREGYIRELERQVAELAALRPDFPAADDTATALGTHMAGVAVRSAVVHRLAFRARGGYPAGPAAEPDWARPRAARPDLEAELNRLVDAADAALRLRTYPDLTEQVAAVDAGFWPHWAVTAPRLAPRLARYLALRRLAEEVKDVWYGFGPLEDLLDDPAVTDIMVIDADHIYVEKGGRKERSGRRFLTDPVPIFQRIAARAGRTVNTSQPMADVRMPDGSRVNITLPPVTPHPTVTIRRFPARRIAMDDLVGRYGSLSTAARDFLRAAVLDRRNILVSGGTGTGKTTLLNCLAAFVPDRDRVVTVEDTAELQLGKEHVVPMQAKPPNIEGKGEVTTRDLVRNALRMRPDRIMVGEVRGGEALDMLQAMNTGHDGSMTTVHANDPAGAIDRLVVLVQQAVASHLPVESIHGQVAAALDVIVQLGEVERDGRKDRVVVEVAEVAGYDPDARAVRLVSLFRRTGAGPLAPTGHLPSFLPELVAKGLVPDPVALVRDDAGPDPVAGDAEGER